MQLAEMVAELPDIVTVKSLTGLSGAWTVSFPGARNAIAASSNPEFAFQVNAVENVSDDYLRSILSTAREHSGVLLAAAPMAKVDDVSIAGTEFTSFISVRPSVANMWRGWSDGLSAVTYAVAGGWACEVSGDEDEREGAFRFDKAFAIDVDREPVPFMRLAFDDGAGGGTVPGRRHVLAPDTLYSFLARPRERGFAEFENFRHEVRRVEMTSSGPVEVDGDRRVPKDPDRLVEDARAFLLGRRTDASHARRV